MGSKVYAPQTSNTATDLARVFNLSFGNITNQKIGSTIGTSIASGSAKSGGAGEGAPLVQGADQSGGISFENMISGIDEKELELMKTLIGANYSLSLSTGQVSAENAQKYSEAIGQVTEVKKITSDMEKMVKDNFKLILIGGIIVTLFLISRGKK